MLEIKMSQGFHLVDLGSQVGAVKQLLEGKSANEKLTWLSSRGKVTQIEKKKTEWPETYSFESATGVECTFIRQENIFRLVGDNHLSNIEF